MFSKYAYAKFHLNMLLTSDLIEGWSLQALYWDGAGILSVFLAFYIPLLLFNLVRFNLHTRNDLKRRLVLKPATSRQLKK